jgi:hypothetical protein
VSEFEIVYTIRRNYQDIGFGVGMGGSVDSAAFDMESQIQNRVWETSAGMPDPREADNAEAAT